jgi:hypothetical protein
MRKSPSMVQINVPRDWGWVRIAIADANRPAAERAMLLEAAMRLAPSQQEWRDHLVRLKSLVADRPELMATIDERLKPSQHDEEMKRLENAEAKREEQRERRKAEDHASWVTFWRRNNRISRSRPSTAATPPGISGTRWVKLGTRAANPAGTGAL